MSQVTPSVSRARRALAGLFVTALVLAAATLGCAVRLLLP